MNLYWFGLLEGHFKNFNFRGVGGPRSPLRWKYQVYPNFVNLKPKFNFIHVLIISKDILGTFGALHA